MGSRATMIIPKKMKKWKCKYYVEKWQSIILNKGVNLNSLMKHGGLRGVKACLRFRRTLHVKRLACLINRNFQGGFKEAHLPSLDPQNSIQQQKCEHTGSSSPVGVRFSVSVLLKPTFLEFPPCNKLSSAILHIFAGVCIFCLGL